MTVLRAKRLRDLFIETAIAIALVVSLLVFTFEHPRTPINWNGVALLVNTAIVFGYLIAWFRYAWRRSRFWMWLGALLVGHLVICIFVLSHLGQVPSVFYALASVGELAILGPFLRNQISD